MELLFALEYLHSKGITCRNLSLDNIILGPEGNLILKDYYVYFITGSGEDVDFPIGSLNHLPPEFYVDPDNSSNSKVLKQFL